MSHQHSSDEAAVSTLLEVEGLSPCTTTSSSTDMDMQNLGLQVKSVRLHESQSAVENSSEPLKAPDLPPRREEIGDLVYTQYDGNEDDMKDVIKLMEEDLSEPYTIYTYRFFMNQWPRLCFLVKNKRMENRLVGAVVCKLEYHRSKTYRGYIGMLAVSKDHRKQGIASKLVTLCLEEMKQHSCDEAVLETEVDNVGALKLYEDLGFFRDKRLHRYYLNRKDAFRLKLWFY